MDINCDLGEGIGNDAHLMKYLGSCNIACGGHTGSFETMKQTLLLAKKHGVNVGAHPSFIDPENFGRKELLVPDKLLIAQLLNQINTLIEIADSLDIQLHHIKPHGALYNMAAKSEDTAQVIIEVMKNFSDKLILYVPFNSKIENLAKKEGISIFREAFADRNYNDDFSLVSRSKPFAIIENAQDVKNRVNDIINNQYITSINGAIMKAKIDTVCVHGDHVNALQVVKLLAGFKTEIN